MAKYDFTPISNIITEMIMKKASLKELDRMVEYSQKLMDCEKAYVENNIQALIKKYCVDEPVELTEQEKAYVGNDIRACEEKRIDLNEEFASVLSDRGPAYHANDYIHFEYRGTVHFGRVMSYSPATLRYQVWELDEGTIYSVTPLDIIPEEEKKDGENK